MLLFSQQLQKVNQSSLYIIESIMRIKHEQQNCQRINTRQKNLIQRTCLSLAFLFILSTAFYTIYFVKTIDVFDQSHKQYQSTNQITQFPNQISPRKLFTTTARRTSSLLNYCSAQGVNITQAQKAQATGFMSTVDTYFSGNSSEIVKSIYKLDFTFMLTNTQTLGFGYVVYVGAFVIALVSILVMTPFIMCCCICSEDCPPDCCRKTRGDSYSRGQLLLPVIVTVIMMVIAMGTSIPAMTRTKPIFDNFECSVAMAYDNMLNGNVTTNGQSFFAGLKTISLQMGYLNGNLSTIQTQLTKINGSPGSTLDTANTHATSALTSITTMPNGANTLGLTHSYNVPLFQMTTTGSVDSKISASIGTYSSAGSLTHQLYSSTKQIKDDMEVIKNASAAIVPQLVPSGVGTQISTTIANIAPVIANLQSIQSTSISVLAASLKEVDSYVQTYSLVLYGLILAVCFINLVAILIMKCFDLPKCRYVMYFACIFIFFGSVITLAISIFLATSMPVFYYTCNFADFALSSPDNFYDSYMSLSDTNQTITAQYLSVCVKGTGDIMLKVLPSFSGNIDNLKTSLYSSATYDFTNMAKNSSTAINNIKSAVDSYGSGSLLDFETNSGLGAQQAASFKGMSEKTLYTASCPQSSFTTFYTDVWVPGISTQLQQIVSCNGKLTISPVECPSGVHSSCPTSRCLNTFKFARSYIGGTGSAGFVSNINTRYGTTCTAFNDDISNFYTKYVTQVASVIGDTVTNSADTTKLAGRVVSVSNNVNTFTNYMTNTVKPLFSSIKATLANSADSVVNSQTGMLKGLNCSILQEDLVRIRNSLCVTSFGRMFVSFLMAGLISLALTFGVCCTACAGVQHMNDSRKKTIQVNIDESMINIDSMNLGSYNYGSKHSFS